MFEHILAAAAQVEARTVEEGGGWKTAAVRLFQWISTLPVPTGVEHPDHIAAIHRAVEGGNHLIERGGGVVRQQQESEADQTDYHGGRG